MATTPLPLNERPYYNTDSIANSIAADSMFDCFLEAVPGLGFVTRRRPGLKEFTDTGTSKPGDGLFYWEAKGILIAVSNGSVYNVTEDGTCTVLTGAALSGAGLPATFADGQDKDGNPWLYIADGTLIYTTDGLVKIHPEYMGNKLITANHIGFDTVATGASWTLSTTHGPTVADAVLVHFTNVSPNDYSATTAVITGTDIYNVAQTETVTLPQSTGAVSSTNYYKTVTSIVPSSDIKGTPSVDGFKSGATGSTWPLTVTTPADLLAHLVTITNNSTTDYSDKTATITGTDIFGSTQTEIVYLPAGSLSVVLTKYFATVTTVNPSASVGTDTMDIGWSAVGIQIGWTEQSIELTSSNVPPATHVAFIKGSFLANYPGTNSFLFTDVSPVTNMMDTAYWGSVDNPLTCDAKGDNLLAIFAAWQELYACGSQGNEIWQNDGVTPYSPIAGAFSEGGIEAPYSFVVADNTVFMLSVIAGTRVVVKLQGRAPVVISDPIARILSEMEDVSDAIGDLIGVGGLAMYLLTFPSAKQTWAYDYKNDVWVRWGYWDAESGLHNHFIGQHATYVKKWNKHLIQSRLDGKIYELDRNTFDDDGAEMVSYRRTGWINHGTYNRKVCDQFYVKCKAGMSNIGTLLVRWRDEGREEWGAWVDIPLQPVGQRDFIAKTNRFGMYRSRQYEFRLSDNADLVLVGVDTELRGLSS